MSSSPQSADPDVWKPAPSDIAGHFAAICDYAAVRLERPGADASEIADVADDLRMMRDMLSIASAVPAV